MRSRLEDIFAIGFVLLFSTVIGVMALIPVGVWALKNRKKLKRLYQIELCRQKRLENGIERN